MISNSRISGFKGLWVADRVESVFLRIGLMPRLLTCGCRSRRTSTILLKKEKGT